MFDDNLKEEWYKKIKVNWYYLKKYLKIIKKFYL
jgi:hypothetical protein